MQWERGSHLPRRGTFSRKASYIFLFLIVLPMMMCRYVSRSRAHSLQGVRACGGFTLEAVSKRRLPQWS